MRYVVATLKTYCQSYTSLNIFTKQLLEMCHLWLSLCFLLIIPKFHFFLSYYMAFILFIFTFVYKI